MLSSKKGELKRHIRKMLSDYSTAVTINRIDKTAFEIELKPGGMGRMYHFDEFDDEGDPCTDADHDEVYEACVAIVDEHNQNLA
tara:strand:- start:42 stop:293 length:252 start_codon:yes stop_codon:yes gene_type:complete